MWCHEKERIADRFRMGDHESPLAQIVQNKARENDKSPCQANGHFTEMAHVSVKRFAAGYGEKYTTDHKQCEPRLMEQHADAVDRVQRVKDCEIIADMEKADKS